MTAMLQQLPEAADAECGVRYHEHTPLRVFSHDRPECNATSWKDRSCIKFLPFTFVLVLLDISNAPRSMQVSVVTPIEVWNRKQCVFLFR